MTRLGWHLALIALAVLALALYGQEQRKRGAAEANATEWERKARALAVLTARVDTVYRADTVRLTRWRTQYDTLRTTLNVHDTVEVLRFVAVADSTITACSVALVTCEQRVAARDAELRNWHRRWQARPTPPSAFQQWTERAVVFGLGYLVGR